jgi:hypothetical protein
MQKEEYMIQIWGGAWNRDAEPSIEKDLGIKEGYYYFDTEKELQDFEKKLDKYSHLGLAKDKKHGIMNHKRTIAVCTFKYKDKEYIIDYDFGYEYPKESAEFMFSDGNYACDCNRSVFIQRYCEPSFPEMDCGNKIELLGLKVRFVPFPDPPKEE